jgi:mono/diheme cytochrome c family protein
LVVCAPHQNCFALSIADANRASSFARIKAASRMKILFAASLALVTLVQTSLSFGDTANGKALYTQRCAMCHGAEIKGTGPLARKSNPPTPDLTTSAFKKRFSDYPGVIVSSIILRPNGDLIPKTLRENGVKLAPHAWTVNDLRDLNQYMRGVIVK